MDRHRLHQHMKRHHDLPPELRDHDVDGSYRGYLATLTNHEMEVAHLIAHAHDLTLGIENHTHPSED